MISDRDIHNAAIFIVDDQQLYIRLLEQIIRLAGYTRIHSTSDPRQALVVFRDVRPDLVLLDIRMPTADGFQIMKQMRDARSGEYLPILALSEETGQEIRLKALEAGAADLLHKPFEDLEVLMRIRNMITARLLYRRVQDQNVLLEDKVCERTKELSDTRLDIIRRLARAAEFRDTDTGIHIIRMSRYCAILGKTAGMSEEECDLLLHASPLHDIGKIGIPDSILLKPGRLTPDEFEVMKTHATIGAELLSGSDSELMKMAQTIALTHQERWDGSGYPRGLKADEIPLVGRICGICDAFDAMTGARPYKPAWPVEKAVEEIKKESGKHFDPKLVECFLTVLPDMVKVKEECPE